MLPVKPIFYNLSPNERMLFLISSARVKILEDTRDLHIHEKVNILAMMLGYKWITDIAIDEELAKATEVLELLNLSYEKNYYEYQGERHEWLQVAANQAILRYVIDRRDDLSVIEAGLLYGYPLSHSLGYVGLVDKAMKGDDKNIAEFYLSGVFSKEYTKRETRYFESVWDDIVSHSRVIALEAEEYYRKAREQS